MSEQDTRKIGWSADVAHMMDGLVGKTKKQLRAEAVERLKALRYHTYEDILRGVLGWGHEPHFEDNAVENALIDLLTDDEQEASRHSKTGGYHSKDAQVFSDVVSDETTGSAESYNLGGVSGGETIGNADSYDLDTRELLEADIRKWTECSWVTAPHEKVINWLDRQAAITKAENEESECTIVGAWDDYATELENECDELRQQVDSLTAERYGLKARVKFQQSQIDASHLAFKIANEEYDKLDRKCDELKEEIAKYEHDCGLLFDEKHKLTADAKRWADAANRQRLVAIEQAYKVQELTAECDELQAAIDAMENGQFYAMYRRACEERDGLKRKHEQERQQMQRVIETQRESFRKMEFELAQAKGGSNDEG